MLLLLRNYKLAIFGVFLLISVLTSYKLGVVVTTAKYDAALLEFRVKQDELILELNKASEEINKRKTTDVRTIYIEKDDSGCADIAVPDGVLQAINGNKSSTN